MAALARICSEYPYKLSSSESEVLLSSIRNWSVQHGLAVRPATSFVPRELDPSNSLAVTAPVTLFPSLFPIDCFEEAKAVQSTFNELYARIAADEDWLGKVVEELIEVDDFIAKLWNIHLSVKREGYIQDTSLGLFRSDYLLHQSTPDSSEKSTVKQVEFNTISSSFGGLSSKVADLHRYLSKDGIYPDEANDLINKSLLPTNSCIEQLSKGLSQAFHHYRKQVDGRSSNTLCILFVVQNTENNIFDQLPLSETLFNSGIKTFRIFLSEVLAHTHIADNDSDRPLYYSPPHQPNRIYEVSVCYFRAGYSPTEYTDGSLWRARLQIERSRAIKCPSILTHLAGSKKVQQILATPGSDIMGKFLDGANNDEIERVRRTFTAIYPLDDSSAGRTAVQIATDSGAAGNYVLKPQREGGGNNTYGTKIPRFLESLGSDSRKARAYILMEMIRPPTRKNIIFRNGFTQEGEVICELGIFGVCLWKRTGSGHTNMIENYEAGHLLRTKGSQSEEGGVAAGFAAVDSPCLVDEDGDW